jgi:L-threonylcarbamoyladenylate synthase
LYFSRLALTFLPSTDGLEIKFFTCVSAGYRQFPGVEKAGTTMLQTHTAALFRAAVLQAADLLRAGEVVALPTETVYGLAANALDLQAVKRIFEIKGRPSHNPIIVHVASVEMARQCVSEWPQAADALAKAFWPGPLTLIAPRAKNIPDIVTAGGPTVGVRWPSHPFIQAVIRECGFPLAAPSANLSNRISPTNAEHVRKQLDSKVPLIVDGGQCQVGIESTVVDVSESPPRVLRPGMIHTNALAAVIGQLGATLQQVSGGLKSPGQLPKHYAPKARLVILSWENDDDLKKQLSELNRQHLKVHIIAHTRIPSGEGFAPVSIIPHDAEAFARAIYGELHQCDDEGAELIIVEALPESSEWFAIGDRLKRAAAN